MLKKVWFFSFKTPKLTHFISKVIIHILIMAVIVVLSALASNLVGVIKAVSYCLLFISLLYVLVGTVLLFLNYFRVIK